LQIPENVHLGLSQDMSQQTDRATSSSSLGCLECLLET